MSLCIDDPRGLMQLQFKCPKCGGAFFGTSNAIDWNKAFGHCHTYSSKDGIMCNYTWPRTDEADAKVFVPKIVTP